MSAAHLRQEPPPPGSEAPRPAFQPGCSGKAKHSKRQATATLLRRRAGQIYECEHCHSWHTSSVPATVPRKKDTTA